MENLINEIVDTTNERNEKIATIKQDAKKKKLQVVKDAKKSNKVETAKKENLQKINFNLLADSVKGVIDIHTSNASGERSKMYIYPDNIPPLLQSTAKGKNWRKKMREQLNAICNKIQVSYDRKDNAATFANVETFKKFYKTFFRINDFTLQSITQISEEKLQAKEYQKALNIVKQIIAMSEKKKK